MDLVFVSPEEIEEDTLTIRGDTFHHLARVLRLRRGDAVCACDGTGWVYEGRVLRVHRDRLHCSIERRTYRPEQFAAPVVLGQGIPKGRTMDLIVQKATELGVACLVPLFLARSVPRPGADGWAARVGRWRRIAQEAAQQCGRAGMPTVVEPQSLADFLECTSSRPLKVVLWEGERERPLKEVLRKAAGVGGIALLVGPEGGLGPQEVDEAVAAGFVAVSLGRRKLRAETAALAALAIVQYEVGEMG